MSSALVDVSIGSEATHAFASWADAFAWLHGEYLARIGPEFDPESRLEWHVRWHDGWHSNCMCYDIWAACCEDAEAFRLFCDAFDSNLDAE